jgi:hypothetical protein
MARDSTNPGGTWADAVTPAAVANCYEMVRVTPEYATLRFGFDDGAKITEVSRMIVPVTVAAAIGGSLLTEFGRKS